MECQTYFVPTIIILTIAILLNVFGIYILQKQKRRENKQKIILINLSVLDITKEVQIEGIISFKKLLKYACCEHGWPPG